MAHARAGNSNLWRDFFFNLCQKKLRVEGLKPTAHWQSVILLWLLTRINFIMRNDNITYRLAVSVVLLS